MSDRQLSRREVVAGLTALGLVGGLGGTAATRGTLGKLADGEVLASELKSGSVDLRVAATHAGESSIADGSTVVLPLDTLDAETRRGSARVTTSLVGVNANPAAVWLRADCPVPDGSLLAERLTVTLSVGDCVNEPTMLASGSLRTVASTLRAGVDLTDFVGVDCLDTDSALCLDVSWSLDDEYAGYEELSWPITFGAVQCRHDDGTNPFESVVAEPCPGPAPCECCVRVGKLDVDPAESEAVLVENYLPPGRYAFTEGTPDYELVVTDSVEKSDGETVAVAFYLDPVGDAPSPQLCRVELVGDRTRTTYSAVTLGAPDAATPGVLFGPPMVNDPESLEEYYAISHMTVSICQPQTTAGICPDDPEWAK